MKTENALAVILNVETKQVATIRVNIHYRNSLKMGVTTQLMMLRLLVNGGAGIQKQTLAWIVGAQVFLL